MITVSTKPKEADGQVGARAGHGDSRSDQQIPIATRV